MQREQRADWKMVDEPCENRVLAPQYSRRILHVCWLQVLVTIPTALLYGRHDLAAATCAVFATSMNYWRHPLYDSWRRCIDMGTVAIALGYHVWCAASSSRWFLFYALWGVATLLYLRARSIGKADPDQSSKSHAWLHVFANLGNSVMYSGTAPVVLGTGAATMAKLVVAYAAVVALCALVATVRAAWRRRNVTK